MAPMGLDKPGHISFDMSGRNQAASVNTLEIPTSRAGRAGFGGQWQA